MCEASELLTIEGKTVRVTLAGGFPNTFKNEAGEWIGADLSFQALLQRRFRFTAEIKAFATAKQSFGLVTHLVLGRIAGTSPVAYSDTTYSDSWLK